jgi:hypothetical protein
MAGSRITVTAVFFLRIEQGRSLSPEELGTPRQSWLSNSTLLDVVSARPINLLRAVLVLSRALGVTSDNQAIPEDQ